MNAVEIEAAVAELASQPFERDEFPFAFLAAFGNKATTIQRLRKGNTNKSDVPDGVLQRNNIHLATCDAGNVRATLDALRRSPETAKAKAKFILATDGETVEAENLVDGDTLASDYVDLAEHFGFFLPLAGISTVREIKENPIDVRATGRLNKLYVELLKHNRDWAGDERRHDMNHFMARLIFCFFAEDTDIFDGEGLFTRTIERMSEADGSNLHQVMATVFQSMDVKPAERKAAGLPAWVSAFPYVNGSLFAGSTEVPRFTKLARSYLLHAGDLDWKAINPDIFGSMIQAVADDDERGELGMHYTSVPNILKVLNPLFLDDLRQQLKDAGDNARKLLNLRKRMARIRVFDPACGSGNFLVIAYKQMRDIEAAINAKRGEANRKSDIPLTNFRGIELRDFACEVARLALVIAEYQSDVKHRGQKEALKEFLPLSADNWITRGNALRLDWLTVCPPTGAGVKLQGDDLFETPLDQAEIDFENEGGETYICGNPPYLGSKWQSAEQKDDLGTIFKSHIKGWKSLDYVAGWFMKAALYDQHALAASAFVATNSICQGSQVPLLWPSLFDTGHEISFAHTSFKWANLAAHNAGVTVVIVGIARHAGPQRRIYSIPEDITDGELSCKTVDNINAYLIAAPNVEVHALSHPTGDKAPMQFGNHPYYGSPLIFSQQEARNMIAATPAAAPFIRPLYGSKELIDNAPRACLWIEDDVLEDALAIPAIVDRVADVAEKRFAATKDKAAQKLARTPHRFRDTFVAKSHQFGIPRVSSENRQYLPIALLDSRCVMQDAALSMYDAPLWNLALIASRLHLVWIATVCGKLKTDFRYSNTLGWNTFPVPPLTDQMKADLTRAAEDILLAREAHFPATIADLYAEGAMPEDLRHAHDRNDDILERIYIGRRFKNDTERLEKLFDLYTRMTGKTSAPAATH
ncbi:MAG TPA: DNA methyltransferase [Rhodanobacteraceae bacterium]|nr:DNA methyltransferase [Rhodanobacteraceae bacterium]